MAIFTFKTVRSILRLSYQATPLLRFVFNSRSVDMVVVSWMSLAEVSLLKFIWPGVLVEIQDEKFRNMHEKNFNPWTGWMKTFI